MVYNQSEDQICYIANYISEVTNSTSPEVSQYEMLLDSLLSVCSTISDDTQHDFTTLSEAVARLNSRLLAKYDQECERFDLADSLECFNQKYSICKAPSFNDYAEVLVSVLAMEVVLIGNGTLDVKYFGHSIKRDFVSVLGRFLFLYNGFLENNYQKESTTYSDILNQIFSHSIIIASSLHWSIDELPQLRVLILNLIDAIGGNDKSDIQNILNEFVLSSSRGNLRIQDESVNTISWCVEKYCEFVQRQSNIVEIKVSWLYGYIYKKRFGFMFCRKFAKSANASSLPYRFVAYSSAFKNGTALLVSNGPKVVLLESGENKRSSEYVPTQSSFYYNATSGKFE